LEALSIVTTTHLPFPSLSFTSNKISGLSRSLSQTLTARTPWAWSRGRSRRTRSWPRRSTTPAGPRSAPDSTTTRTPGRRPRTPTRSGFRYGTSAPPFPSSFNSLLSVFLSFGYFRSFLSAFCFVLSLSLFLFLSLSLSVSRFFLYSIPMVIK